MKIGTSIQNALVRFEPVAPQWMKDLLSTKAINPSSVTDLEELKTLTVKTKNFSCASSGTTEKVVDAGQQPKESRTRAWPQAPLSPDYWW